MAEVVGGADPDVIKEGNQLPKYEAAKRCPKCGKVGTLSRTVSLTGPHSGTKVESYTCMTELCPWYQTGWIIQINPDGSIPDYTPGPKQFEIPRHEKRKGEEIIDRLRAEYEESLREKPR